MMGRARRLEREQIAELVAGQRERERPPDGVLHLQPLHDLQRKRVVGLRDVRVDELDRSVGGDWDTLVPDWGDQGFSAVGSGGRE